MSKIQEANIGAAGNKYVIKFIDTVANEIKQRFQKLKGNPYYTLPMETIRDEKPELFKALSSFSFGFGSGERDPDGEYEDDPEDFNRYPDVEWFGGDKMGSFTVYIQAEWFNEKPEKGAYRDLFSTRGEYDPLRGGIVSAGSVTPMGNGSSMRLELNIGATPSQFVKYFEHGTRENWNGFESFRSILDHEALHMFDTMKYNKVQHMWNEPYFNPSRFAPDEDMLRYFIQPLEFRAWMTGVIRDLESSYKKNPNADLKTHLENSGNWGRLRVLRELYELLKSGATPKEPESGEHFRMGGSQETLNQLHLKAGRRYNGIKRKILKNVPKMYKYVAEWYNRKQSGAKKIEMKPKTLKSFGDIDYHKDIVSKKRVAEGKDYIDFQIHDKLNPKLWEGDTLKSDVREKLLKIAVAFHKFLNVKAKLKDVIITGSSSNYNYSPKYSDIDLHVLYDFDDVLSEEEEEPIETKEDLIKEYMLAKKTIWNDKFEVDINGLEVEVYPQDIDEPHEATGQFSIVRNTWKVKPSKDFPSIDEKGAEKKADEVMKLIDKALKGDISIDSINRLKDKIKKLRQSGLDSEKGEFSIENLAFKILRRSGYIEKLWDAEEDQQEKEMSL